MKFNCQSCHKDINNMDIKSRRREGLALKKQCPQCNTWLQLNPKIDALKTIGLTILLTASLLNIFRLFPAFEIELSIVSIAGISLAFFAFLAGKLEIVDAE